MGRVPHADAEAITGTESALGQRARQLAGPAIELAPRERRLAAVKGDEHEPGRVRTLLGQLADAAAKARGLHEATVVDVDIDVGITTRM